MLDIVKRHKKIFTDTAAMLTGEIVDKGLRFLIIMIVVRALDSEEYGTYVLLFAMIELVIGFLDFNLFQAVVRFSNMVRDWQSKIAIIVTSYFIEFIVGTLSFAVIYLVVIVGKHFGYIGLFGGHWDLVFFSALYVFLFPLVRNCQATLQAMNNFRMLSFYKIISSFLVCSMLSVNIVGIVNTINVAYIMFAYVMSLLCAFFVGYLCTRKIMLRDCLVKDSRMSCAISREWTSRLLLFSIFPFIQGCLSIMWCRVDLFLLAYFLTKSEVGIFRNGILLIPILSMVFSSFVSVLFPKIVSKYRDNGNGILKSYNELYIYMIFSILLPTAAILSYYSEDVILFFFTSRYLKSADIFRYAVLVYPFAIVNGIGVNWVVAMGRQKLWTFSALLAFACSFVLNITLIPYYGIKGAALAYCMCNCIIFIYVSFVIAKITNTKYWDTTNIISVLLYALYVFAIFNMPCVKGVILILYLISILLFFGLSVRFRISLFRGVYNVYINARGGALI